MLLLKHLIFKNLTFVFKIGKDWNILIDQDVVLLVALFLSELFGIIGLSST